jgi:hypothetical protein
MESNPRTSTEQEVMKLALSVDDIRELAIFPTKVLQAEIQRRRNAQKLAMEQARQAKGLTTNIR